MRSDHGRRAVRRSRQYRQGASAAGGVDHELVKRLDDHGYLDVFAGATGLGPIAAVLVAELGGRRAHSRRVAAAAGATR